MPLHYAISKKHGSRGRMNVDLFRENVFSKDPGQRSCPEKMGLFLAVEENAEDDGNGY